MAPLVDSLELSLELIDAIVGDGSYLALVYQAFFDESGTHSGSPYMTVAAYVFSKSGARQFSEAWALKLKGLGLSHAHTTDCATGNGEYSKLSKENRVQSEKELIALIKKHSVAGACISIDAGHYARAMKGKTHVYGPYTFILLQVVDRISKVIASRDKGALVNYFFESGHESANEAHRFMNSIKNYGGEVGDNYASHTFADKKKFLPLQAADMLAWQYRHLLVRATSGHHQPRKDFLALLQKSDFCTDVKNSHIDWLAGMFEKIDPLKTSGPLDLLLKLNQHLLKTGLPI